MNLNRDNSKDKKTSSDESSAYETDSVKRDAKEKIKQLNLEFANTDFKTQEFMKLRKQLYGFNPENLPVVR